MTATVVKKNLDFVGEPGEQVAAARAVRAGRRDRDGEQRRAHRHRHDSDAEALHDPGPRARCRWSARRGSPTAACSPRHRRDRPVHADERSRRRPLHLRRAQGLHVGARTARRPPSSGLPAKVTRQGHHERDARRRTSCSPAGSTSRRSPGRIARGSTSPSCSRSSRRRSRTRSCSTRTRDIPAPTRPSARRSCRR